jgi:DNA-binding CsgD family transcriptional regulator
LTDGLKAHLGQRQVLLLLDNFEHVLPAAPQLSELLGAAPGLRLLVTSREPLHLRWEHTFVVKLLRVPSPRLEPVQTAPEPAPEIHDAVQDAGAVLVGVSRHIGDLQGVLAAAAHSLFARVSANHRVSRRPIQLTAPQCDILRLLIRELSSREIAERLRVPEPTVAADVAGIIAVLGDPNRARQLGNNQSWSTRPSNGRRMPERPGPLVLDERGGLGARDLTDAREVEEVALDSGASLRRRTGCLPRNVSVRKLETALGQAEISQDLESQPQSGNCSARPAPCDTASNGVHKSVVSGSRGMTSAQTKYTSGMNGNGIMATSQSKRTIVGSISR